jgi:ankyrin repeat protein
MQEKLNEYNYYSLNRILNDFIKDGNQNATLFFDYIQKLELYLLSLNCYNNYERKLDIILNHITNGDVESVKLFFMQEKEFVIDRPYDQDGWNFLLYASMEGQYQIVKLLIDMGADPNIESTECEPQSALQLAVEERHYQVVKLLDSITNHSIREKVKNQYPNYPSWL